MIGGAKAVHHRETLKLNGTTATELPYRVEKVTLPEHVASTVNKKDLDGIADLRDTSNCDGPKQDASADTDDLPKGTHLWTTSSGNFLALLGGRTEPRRFTPNTYL